MNKTRQEPASIINWTKSLVNSMKPDNLDFCFHGGEPSLYPEKVEEISKGLSAISAETGIGLSQSMVSNATLANKKFVEMLKNRKIDRLVCTLDGPPEIHDKRRPLVSGAPTFRQTLANIEDLLKAGLAVCLNVNVDRSNSDHIGKLLDILENERLEGTPNLFLAFSIIKEGPAAENAGFFEQNLLLEAEAQTLLELYFQAQSRNFHIIDPLSPGLCSIRQHANFIVDEFGDIYKCITLAGNANAWVGHISHPLSSVIKKSAQLLFTPSWENSQHCRECKFMPICLGGCRQQVFLKSGNFGGILCRRAFFERYVPDAMELRYHRTRSSAKSGENIPESIHV